MFSSKSNHTHTRLPCAALPEELSARPMFYSLLHRQNTSAANPLNDICCQFSWSIPAACLIFTGVKICLDGDGSAGGQWRGDPGVRASRQSEKWGVSKEWSGAGGCSKQDLICWDNNSVHARPDCLTTQEVCNMAPLNQNTINHHANSYSGDEDLFLVIGPQQEWPIWTP